MLRKALAGEKKLGISGTGLSYSAFKEVQKLTAAEMVDITDAIDAARAVKDDEEIERMRRACRIAAEVGDELADIVRPGMKEYEAAAEVSYRMQKRGASAASFATNASFGANSAEPHHSPGDDKLRKGDAVLFDFGALYRRYGSDVTRTFFYGKASKKQRQMYEVVLQAQQTAIDGIRPGMTGQGGGRLGEGRHRRLAVQGDAHPFARPRPGAGGSRRRPAGPQLRPGARRRT